MKKLVFVLFLIFGVASYSLDAHVRVGALADSEDYRGEDRYRSYAPTVGFEVTQPLVFATVGAGVQYFGKTSGSDISTVPVYGLLKWNIIPVGIKPYAVAKLGRVAHSSNNYDIKGKGFYGAGLGMDVANVQVELLYSITKLDDDRWLKSDDLKQISLTFGYQIW